MSKGSKKNEKLQGQRQVTRANGRRGKKEQPRKSDSKYRRKLGYYR